MLMGMLIYLDVMFLLYSASKYDRTYEDVNDLAATVRQLSVKIYNTLMNMYHVPAELIGTFNVIRRSDNEDIDFASNPPSTNIEILAYVLRSVSPHPDIVKFLPFEFQVTELNDGNLVSVREMMKSILVP
jgi:hypothetical protein